MEQLTAPLQTVLDTVTALLAAHPMVGEWYTAFVRFFFPVLAVLILWRAVKALLKIPHTPETWGQLSLPNGTPILLTHWENIIGRGKTADVYLNYPSISRQHAALCRGEDECWTVYDLGSKGGTAVNGEPVAGSAPVKLGDTITLGGVPLVFLPQTAAERQELEEKRRAERPVAVWPSFLWLTVFQVLACLQLIAAAGESASVMIPLAFLGLTAVMWVYFAILRATHCVGFEMETIAFFLSTLSLSVTASSAPGSLFKQFAAILLGLVLFLVLGLFLRDLGRVQKNRWLMAAMAIGLLGVTLVIGSRKYGAVNWISIGPFSFQPSEIAKICYIFAGSATLERLFHKRNLTLFIVLTGVCIGCLGLMSDFGTAAIFFVTFLVIAYLRSGDFATLSLICGGAVFGAGIIVKFKPYILARFASWGHAWEAASTTGYQQTRTMSAAASGGLLGMGAGNGWLHKIAAADTDLVFGMLCEEWGLLIALLAVASIITLAFFAVRACKVGRSSFYIIAACAASSLLVFQTCLNVFGSVDLLPLTGVTFPFVSNGGSAMMSAWGLLAFLKATDTRENASFAIRRTGQAKLTEDALRRAGPVGTPSGTQERRTPMKKIERRAIVCLLLALLLAAGMGIFLVRYFVDGGSWASSAFNRHLYNTDGQLAVGTVLDRDGDVLSSAEDGKRTYYKDATVRKATLHAVGDLQGNIGTGALNAFADQLTGYSLLNGAFGAEQGSDLYLTIDARYNYEAYQALNGHKGTVAVYNYKTGEVLCMVSAPSYDPLKVPGDIETNDKWKGAYLNRFLTSSFTPGSVYKTVTLAAALEELPDLEARTWTCTGSAQMGEETIVCSGTHGEQHIGDAFANSCNVAFAQIAEELGADTLKKYTEKAGLTDSYSVSGLPTAKGTFDWTNITPGQLGWAGVGQYKDQVNPCALMVYMGAIANGGKAAEPYLVKKTVSALGLPSLPHLPQKTGTLVSSKTAKALADLMADNVEQTYGTKRFPNMDLCAKSGTAEVGEGKTPHAWFTGFLRNEDAPYAFVALVENGGGGNAVAGTVAGKVLNIMVNGY